MVSYLRCTKVRISLGRVYPCGATFAVFTPILVTFVLFFLATVVGVGSQGAVFLARLVHS